MGHVFRLYQKRVEIDGLPEYCYALGDFEDGKLIGTAKGDRDYILGMLIECKKGVRNGVFKFPERAAPQGQEELELLIQAFKKSDPKSPETAQFHVDMLIPKD